MSKQNDNVTIRDARILWRNFEGNETTFNPKGKRNFHVVLDKDLADILSAKGWNVKVRDARKEGDDPLIHIQVTVAMDGAYPPKVVQLSSSGQLELNQHTIKNLDWADLEKVDLILSPYNWNFNNKEGITAYLKTMYVTLREDELEKEYSMPAEEADVPEEAPF